MKEDEVLHVYDKEEEWYLVQSPSEEGRVGYVPGNYVEEVRLSVSFHVTQRSDKMAARPMKRDRPRHRLYRPQRYRLSSCRTR